MLKLWKEDETHKIWSNISSFTMVPEETKMQLYKNPWSSQIASCISVPHSVAGTALAGSWIADIL